MAQKGKTRLATKRILLGVSGGIAAYKAVEILRRLQDEGAEVRVVMTESACRFVQPLTFEALSHRKVETQLFPDEGDPNIRHIELAKWPDAILIAPATAHVLGRAANGLADDLLTNILLAAETRVFAVPAMESQMYANEAVQNNLDALRSRGYTLIGPASGPLASGASGPGRMEEPDCVVQAVCDALGPRGDLAGKRVLVTAGRTEEDIDPVRFITNRSTGKMGYAVAERAVARGACVTLVSGPTHLETPAGVERVDVRSVSEMETATRAAFDGADVLVMTAAVLDFRPTLQADQKIKKDGKSLNVSFEPTYDFLVDLGQEKGERLVVGFAVETENVEANAKSKLEKKSLDLIVLNDLNIEGAGFGVDTNVVTLFDREGGRQVCDLASKHEVSDRILDWVVSAWAQT
ncbi:MAG: bifunctional phosphopantothenoylcysteine decarboxylase/phosphopantothenate--cysteine ligase CoaBC [Gemmatimonadetes bacterium]|nr:bifunctional phosphopantothenoylcysteine decarboxylase/phosphopantothenate--cysteine ligase CoaBC [Gemmatimonadota bacterium]